MTYAELLRMASDRLFVIGEAGVNHDGSLDKARALVDIAVTAGCDAVKFQTWITEAVYSRTLSQKPEYMLDVTDRAESEFETVKKNELSFEAFRELKQYCDRKGILFLSTPDENQSTDFLVSIGQPFLKTSSQDVTNLPFLRYVAGKGLPVIFSSGASTLAETTEAVETILAENKEVVLFHTVSAYPAPTEEMNLRVIPTLERLFGLPVGLSDHTTGIEASCAAVALGARIFEKHFTADPSAPGPDHRASLAPSQLKDYVDTLRSVYRGLGDGIKRVMPCEENVRQTFRRFLVSAAEIPKGHVFRFEDFHFKKISTGIAPKDIVRIVGRPANQDIRADEPIDWNHVS